MGGGIHIRDKRKGDAAVKALTKKRKRVQADTETGIEGAGKRLESLEKEVAELRDELLSLAGIVGKLWAWKLMQEMKDESIKTD